MNKVMLTGNLTRDPDYRTLQDGTPVCNFCIAVNRAYKNKDGEHDADFINCTAFKSTADFMRKYFVKGSLVSVAGEIQTRKYTTKNGDERHITEVKVNEIEPKLIRKNDMMAAVADAPSAEDVFGEELNSYPWGE